MHPSTNQYSRDCLCLLCLDALPKAFRPRGPPNATEAGIRTFTDIKVS